MKLIIIAGIIFGPLIILGISKIISKMSGTVKKANPFKYAFWPLIFLGSVFSKPKKLIAWILIVGAGYGIYLLVNYYTPPKSERLFKEIIVNQIEVQTKDETVNLEEMAESSGTNTLSPDELKLAQKNRTDADKKRKNLEAMLEKPKAKPASVKPKTKTKSVWVARLSADRKQIEEAMHMGVSQAANDKIEIGEENALIKTDIEIRFSYKKRGKMHEAILTRENAELEHYYGIIDLSDNTQLELWFKEKGLESYEGHARQIIKKRGEIIYTPLIKAFLRKEVIIS